MSNRPPCFESESLLGKPVYHRDTEEPLFLIKSCWTTVAIFFISLSQFCNYNEQCDERDADRDVEHKIPHAMSWKKQLAVSEEGTIQHHKDVVVFGFQRLDCVVPLLPRGGRLCDIVLARSLSKTCYFPFVFVAVIFAFECGIYLVQDGQ